MKSVKNSSSDNPKMSARALLEVTKAIVRSFKGTDHVEDRDVDQVAFALACCVDFEALTVSNAQAMIRNQE